MHISDVKFPISIFILSLLIARVASAEVYDVYVANGGQNAEERGIYRISFDDQSGELGAPEKVADNQACNFLELSPDQQTLISRARIEKKEEQAESGAIASYSVNPDGSLTELNVVTSEGRGACHVGFDQSGQVAFTVNYSLGGVCSYRVLDDGSLSDPVSFFRYEGSSAHSGRQEKPHAHSVYAGPKNEFVYVLDLGLDKIFIYRLDPQTAILKESASVDTKPGSGPRHMKFGVDGSFAYVLNELDNTITVYRREMDGMLTQIQIITTLAEDFGQDEFTCSEIRVHPSGKYLYNANRDIKKQGRDSLSTFAIDQETGTLERIQTVPAEVSIPRNITIDPSGNWLVVCGQASGELVVFAIDPKTHSLAFANQRRSMPKPMCTVFRKND